MAKSTNNNGVLVGFWIDPELKAKLKKRAKRQDRSLSALIRWVLAREVD